MPRNGSDNRTLERNERLDKDSSFIHIYRSYFPVRIFFFPSYSRSVCHSSTSLHSSPPSFFRRLEWNEVNVENE